MFNFAQYSLSWVTVIIGLVVTCLVIKWALTNFMPVDEKQELQNGRVIVMDAYRKGYSISNITRMVDSLPRIYKWQRVLHKGAIDTLQWVERQERLSLDKRKP